MSLGDPMPLSEISDRLKVNLGERSYDIRIGPAQIAALGDQSGRGFGELIYGRL